MGQPFSELCHDQRIAVYQQAALEALQAYGFKNSSLCIEPVTFVNNATFKVVVRRRAGAIKYYALRIHRPQEANDEAIRSELRWLIALRQETQLKTPHPVMTNGDSLLNTVALPQCREPLQSVLFEWLEGCFLHTSEQTPTLARQVGQFVGALHQHSQHFSSSHRLVRRRLDAEHLFDWEVLYRLRNANMFVTDEHWVVFLAVRDRVQRAFQELEQSADSFGLIHADLIWKNYFFHEDGVGAVDFDSCGWGYYAYDLAPTLVGYRDEPEYLALRDALLAGYRSVRPFPTHYEGHLNALIAARHLVSCCWLANHLDNPDLRKHAGEIVAYRIAEMQRLLEEAV